MSALVDLSSSIFPTPIKTFKLMFEYLGQKETYRYLGFSIIRLIIGFAASFLLAFLLGIIVNNNDTLYKFFTPLMTFLKAAPTATFIFLFVVLTDGYQAPVFVVILIAFPILYESIVSGLKSTDSNVLEAAKVDGSGKLKTLFFIQLPLGMPYIALGIVSTFALAFKIEIMAEIVTGITEGGIGAMISSYKILSPSDITPMFAYSLMAIILVLLVSILTSLLKSKIGKISTKAVE